MLGTFQYPLSFTLGISLLPPIQITQHINGQARGYGTRQNHE